MEPNESAEDCGSKRDLVMEAKGEFAEEYSKCRSFRLFKPLNLLLLLGITIGTSICAARPDGRLVWSDCWHSVRRLYDPSAEWSHPERMVVVASVLLVFAFISSGMHWFGRKKGAKCCPQFMASLGVTDICLAVIIILMLLPMLWHFAIRSIAEIHWFYPKVMNQSMTMLEFTEWKPQLYHPWNGGVQYVSYHHYTPTTMATTTQLPPESTTLPAYILYSQEMHKRTILMRLWLDPTIAVFTFLAIFLNLINAVRLLLLFKRTKLWSSDYGGTHLTNCSKFETEYAKFWPFGLLKAANWVWPTAYVLLSLYWEHLYMLQNIFLWLIFAIIPVFFFLRWLHYVQEVRFCKVQQQQHEEEGKDGHQLLANMCKKDIFISGIAILVYFLLPHSILSYQFRMMQLRWLFVATILSHAASICFAILLLKRHGGPNRGYSAFGLNMPGISINISVNVYKNGMVAGGEEVKMDDANANKGKETQTKMGGVQ